MNDCMKMETSQRTPIAMPCYDNESRVPRLIGSTKECYLKRRQRNNRNDILTMTLASEHTASFTNAYPLGCCNKRVLSMQPDRPCSRLGIHLESFPAIDTALLNFSRLHIRIKHVQVKRRGNAVGNVKEVVSLSHYAVNDLCFPKFEPRYIKNSPSHNDDNDSMIMTVSGG